MAVRDFVLNCWRVCKMINANSRIEVLIVISGIWVSVDGLNGRRI